MHYREFQTSPVNKLFCKNILIISAPNISDSNLDFLKNEFRYWIILGEDYYLFSDDIIHENESSITVFTGYGISEGIFLKNKNYLQANFDQEYIGNYLYIRFDKESEKIDIKSDFYTNAMKFAYQRQEILLLSNNLIQLLRIIKSLDGDFKYNFNNINFNLEIVIEVLNSNNYFPYFNQFNIERSEIDGYEYIKPYFDLEVNSNKSLSYIPKEIITAHKTDVGTLEYYVNESKKEMLNSYNVLSNEFFGYNFCSDLTAGADSRCLLSLFLEFDIKEMNYQVTLKGKNSVASIGMIDAFYFEFFVKQFDLEKVSLTRYIDGYYGREIYEKLEKYFFERNPHQYQGIANNLIYKNLFLFRGGYGEIFRNYLGFTTSEDLDSYFRRQVHSDVLYEEIKNFLRRNYAFLTDDLSEQHNLNYIFYRQRETVVYNKFEYPFYNLLQSKNLYMAKKYVDLKEDNYALLKSIYIDDLKKVNINDKNQITTEVKVNEINIDELFELKENQEVVSRGLSINRHFNNDYFLQKLIHDLSHVKDKFIENKQDTKPIQKVIESLKKNEQAMNSWRIKNIHYRIKLLKYILE